MNQRYIDHLNEWAPLMILAFGLGRKVIQSMLINRLISTTRFSYKNKKEENSYIHSEQGGKLIPISLDAR